MIVNEDQVIAVGILDDAALRAGLEREGAPLELTAALATEHDEQATTAIASFRVARDLLREGRKVGATPETGGHRLGLLARAEQDMARADSLLHGELFGMCLVVPALLLGIDLGDRLDLLAPR